MNDPYGQWSQPAATTTAVPPAPAPEPSKAMAIWSLVLGAIPVPPGWLVSIGLGIAVLVRSRDGRNHGKTMVIVGFSLIAGWIVVIAAGTVIALAFESQLRPDRPADATGKVHIEDVRVGDCLARDLEDDEITFVELVPCTSSHRLETFAIFNLPKGSFPGYKDVDRLGGDGCESRFEKFVGVPYDDSDIYFQYVTPLKEGWYFDRSVVCFLDTDGMTSGSLKNAKR